MTLERHLAGERLRKGFMTSAGPDVDDFVQFSLSVQNRRKSRAGGAFGNHIEALLETHKIKYKREATTEKRNGPDFLFPGEVEYHNSSWPKDGLTKLAAKTSCKDRWRQVLAEADRIDVKHLLTLEPGISIAQTAEMKDQNLRLVLPEKLHASFRPEQLSDLMSVSGFLVLVQARQRK